MGFFTNVEMKINVWQKICFINLFLFKSKVSKNFENFRRIHNEKNVINNVGTRIGVLGILMNVDVANKLIINNGLLIEIYVVIRLLM